MGMPTVQGIRRRLLFSGWSAGGLFGYSIAVSNNAVSSVQAEFALSALGQGVVVSGLTAGALAGCAAAGVAADRFGRRAVLIGAGVVAAAATVIAALAPHSIVLIAGRLLLGGAIGLTTSVAPLYIAESAPADQRGSLVTHYQLAVAMGNLLSLAVGAALSLDGHWRLMFALNGVPAVLQVVALASSRTGTPRRGAALPQRDGRSLADRAWRRPVIIACVAALMNALVGVGAIVYYSTPLFAIAGLRGEAGAQTASLVVGTVNVVATAVAVPLIRRHGRKPLLTVGLSGTVGTLLVAAWGLATSAGLLTVGAVVLFMVCYAFSAGPIAWLLVAEVAPRPVRARTAAAATSLNWAANLLITLLFPVVVGVPASPGTVAAVFVFFAVLSTGFLIFVRVFLPETKDKAMDETTLEDLDAAAAPDELGWKRGVRSRDDQQTAVDGRTAGDRREP